MKDYILETAAIPCKENERAGYKIVNKSDLKKGQKTLSDEEVAKLDKAAAAAKAGDGEK